MAIAVELLETPGVAAAPMSYWRTVAWRLARDQATLVAGGVLAVIVLSAVLAPWLAPYDPAAGSIRLRLAPVGAPGHVLGTDEQGRDMLSRLLWGGRMTLVAGLTPVLVAFVVGAALGVMAGYVGGLTNTLDHAHDGHLLRVPGRAARDRDLRRARSRARRTRSSRCRSSSCRGSCASPSPPPCR